MPNWSTVQKQARTLETAGRLGTEWTQSECLRLIDLAGEPGGLEHAAHELQRSYFAVMTAHSLLNRGWVPAEIPVQRSNGYRGWLEGMPEEGVA